MALIAIPNVFSAGATILSAEHNENFSPVYNLVNGQLDNDNIKASAAIVDTKLAQITTAGKVSGAALTSLANVPSGAGILPFANIDTIDEDNMSTDSDVKVPTQQSVKAYVDTQVATGIISSILDYATSSSSSTAKSQVNFHIAYGTLTISGNSNSSLSNLPFTNSGSYSIVATFGTNQSATEAIEIVQSSGSAATIYNNDNLQQAIHWQAIGT